MTTKKKTKTIKVFLDDERETPRDWVRTFSPAETIELLKTRAVSDLSLDHDLGDDKNIGTGYDVLLWLEEEQFNDNSFPIPNIQIHSANSAARIRMEQAVKAIIQRWQSGLETHNQ